MAPPTRAELEALSATDVRSPIPDEDLLTAISSAPFVPSRTIVNLRDLGALNLVPGATSSSSSASDARVPLRAGRVFRSGTLQLAKADPEALAWLGANVRRIFDVRSPPERQLAPEVEVAGVETTWFDSSEQDGRPDLLSFAEGNGEKGVQKEYLKVLAIYQPTFRAVLEHVRDRPEDPFLFHCSAGRDRTGVLAGLILAVAGAAPEVIRFDYMLSRIGTEPAREMLLQYARLGTGVTEDEAPGFHNLCRLRPGGWDAFIEGLTSVYGGWDGYVTGALGFSDEDLATMRRNLSS